MNDPVFVDFTNNQNIDVIEYVLHCNVFEKNKVLNEISRLLSRFDTVQFHLVKIIRQ